MTMNSSQSADATTTQNYFTAFFTPQVWVNDYALDIDPEGEQEWTVSDAFVATAARIVADDFLGLDKDDVLRDDPAAPEWIREHSGPFSIHIRPFADDAEGEVRGDICADLRTAGYAAEADEVGGMTLADALDAYERVTSRGWAYTNG